MATPALDLLNPPVPLTVPTLRDLGIGLVAYSPLGRGFLTGTITSVDNLPEDDFRKLQHAWSLVRQRGPENIFIFTGLDHSLPMTPEDLRWADDEIAPALYFDRMTALALADEESLRVPRTEVVPFLKGSHAKPTFGPRLFFWAL